MTAPTTTLTMETPTFQHLLESVWSGALRWASRLTGNLADAEDLRQNAALRALKGFRTFRQGSNFKAWFNRIILNCHRDALRRYSRRPSTVTIAEEVLDPELLAGRALDPAEAAFARMRSDELRAALGRLPAAFREAASLYYLEDRPYQDIAQLLGRPTGTVRSRLNRARGLLQRELAPHLAP